MKAIGYASLSALSAQPSGLGLADQERDIRRYAEDHGLELLGIYTEMRRSNNELRYPELEKVMQAARRGEFEVLIIARLDRLTRNIRHLDAMVRELCVRNGVRLVSIAEELDTTNNSGQLALNIINIFTKWDSKRISDRTREIIARKREKGERVGHAPFGYTYRNKKLVEVPEEQRVVQLIKDKREEGMSYHKIARLLNEEHIASKRGGIWYAETVKTVYQSYTGRERAAQATATGESDGA